jgi:hypothetical protein
MSAQGAMPAPPPGDDAIEVPRWLDFWGGFVRRRERLMLRLGDLESRLLAAELRAVAIDRPIYVSGLARSGSTMLLEILASHPDVVSHRYSDFPPIYTPFWWNWLLARMARRPMAPVERTHRDGIMVTPDSPEAMEEVLWMTFFPEAHDPSRSNVLDRDTTNAGFERFYADHIRKLLLVRGGRRYLAKGNYNVTRLGYIQKLFADARFVIPVRQPAAHVASLIKQHRLFCRGETRNRSVLEHMRRVGHFEFGLDRRPLNTGDTGVDAILALWQSGEEVRGWARYWAQIYGFVADQLQADSRLREACHVVRFEDLCAAPADTIGAMLAHCRLPDPQPVVAAFAPRVEAPKYYEPDFSTAETAIIAAETQATAQRFGY